MLTRYLATANETGLTSNGTNYVGVLSNSYIVTLKDGLNAIDLRSHLQWIDTEHAQSLGKTDQTSGVEYEYFGESFGFLGYAGKFPPQVIDSIRQRSEVT